MGARTGSDETAECVCTGKPVGQAPVGAHQFEVSTVGTVGGWEEEEVEGVGWGEGMAIGYGL